ncbi:MAG TPA: hypothetical protein VGU23_02590 [Acidobacteriaceae bacterium]|nr:hypothetical protein [Acidobacteriaceae bacterium]
MRPLSAAEAISPAIERTKAVFFQPFRKGRSWKLAATAYLSMMGCVFLPIPLLLLLLPWIARHDHGRSVALIFAGIIIVYSVIMWVFFYIGARLQFVLFEIVLRKIEFVAPAWRFYRRQAWRWIGLKVAFGTVLSAVAGVPLAIWFLRILPQFTVQPGQPPSPQMFGAIFGAYFGVLGFTGLIFLACSLLGDFVLPYIALEDASLSTALRRFRQVVEDEPGQMVLFLFFKILLAITSLIALEIVIVVVEILIAVPLGIFALLGWLILHHLGPVGIVLMATGGALLYILFFIAMFYFMLGFQGAVITFFQAYALYFLGGRYPALGDMLEPPYPVSYPLPAPAEPI